MLDGAGGEHHALDSTVAATIESMTDWQPSRSPEHSATPDDVAERPAEVIAQRFTA